MYAPDELERAVSDMRAQFRTISGQIADELGRLAQNALASPAAVHERVVTAIAQIASTQHFLRAESDRLPADPQEACIIMQSVLQAQQGALHQLAIIVKQHAPGWYPNLSNTAASYPSAPAATPAWYPSPPTVQELAGQNWPQAQGNGYATDMQPHSVWPSGGTAMVPNSGLPEVAPWPGRRGYALVPRQQQSSGVIRTARGYGSNNGQMLATARRQALDVAHGAGSRSLVWIGLVVAGLIFAYLSFPFEIRQKEAVARPTTAMQDADERTPVAIEPRPRVVANAPPQPTLIARAPDEDPPPSPAPAASGMVLPGGLMVGSPGVAVGWPGQANAPPIAREPPPSAEVAAEPATPPLVRLKQRAAPSRVEGTSPPAEATPRSERFAAVLFTHQDEPTATQAFADLQQQYPNVLANREGQTQAVDLGKKGVWHRLVVPATSRQEASNLCMQLMGAGYEKCWVKPY